MKRLRTWTTIAGALCLLFAATWLPGCPEGEGGGGGGTTTVEEICGAVFDCFDNDWGWSSEEECVDLWFTDCADEDGYLGCTAACVTDDCADFAVEDGTSGCEPDCWEDFCM